jgi:hypothetical protein
MSQLQPLCPSYYAALTLAEASHFEFAVRIDHEAAAYAQVGGKLLVRRRGLLHAGRKV